ncbi:hypothetical protein [Nocardioides terrisoli]|uniref:hypothetical protein n=1 Tax=Nocardioides terrisoli TaxID=3388267 RepID=UPI00287BA705|nr:hypothetical protein [Nocardioides marmorisolisilvae]
MSVSPAEPTPTAPVQAAESTTPEPVPQAPAEAAPVAKRSLEDLLGGLDDDARSVILGEVSKARNEAKNLRDRFKEAEPKLTEYERLVEASKSDLERAQEAAKAANDRATGMLRDVASAKVEAALSALPDDVRATLLEDINVDKFITDGEVDAEKIGALREKYAAFANPEKPGMKPNPSQGRSASPAPSLGEQITQAQAAGDFKTAIRLKSQMALNSSND